jgi:toxin HigB-1
MDLSVVAWMPLIRYYRHMITSFGDKITSDLFHGISSRHASKLPSQIHELALYKLDVLNAAEALDDLRSPPGNRLEALKGVLKDFYGIRINSQWRIIFRWAESSATDVQIMDYH